MRYIDILFPLMLDYHPYFKGQETRAAEVQGPGHAIQPHCIASSFTAEVDRKSPVSFALCLPPRSSDSHPFLSSLKVLRDWMVQKV